MCAGLLGIALANEAYADEAVQTQLIAACCAYFQKAVLTPHQLSTAQRASLEQQQQQQAASWDRHKTPAKPALKTAAAEATAAAAELAVGQGQSTAGQDSASIPQEGNSSQWGSREHDPQQQQQQQEQEQEGLEGHQQEQLPGNAFLSLVAASLDGGLVGGDEVLQLRLRMLLGVMRILTCTGVFWEGVRKGGG
jgi:hypothetical protein